MTTHQLRVVHSLLRLGGAVAVYHVQRTPPAQRLSRAVALGMVGIALSAMVDGQRGAAELVRGAAEAMRQLL